MMKKIFFSGIIITCILRGQALASTAGGIVEKGNRLYREQKYEDALKHYDQALSTQPDSAVINFDAGTAQYKTNEYQKANASFEKSLITQDKALEAKANYNLGNSRYMLGLTKENSDLAGAVQLLEGTLNNYKRAMELVPKDQDAKVNYEIVEKKLKELKEKLKKQPQGNKDNQKQENRQKEEEKRSTQAKQEEKKSADQQGQSNQSQGQEAQQKQAEQKTQERQAAAQPSNESEESGPVSTQPEDLKEMSKKEAEMLLEGYRQGENTAGMLRDDRKGREEKVLKDW